MVHKGGSRPGDPFLFAFFNPPVVMGMKSVPNITYTPAPLGFLELSVTFMLTGRPEPCTPGFSLPLWFFWIAVSLASALGRSRWVRRTRSTAPALTVMDWSCRTGSGNAAKNGRMS